MGTTGAMGMADAVNDGMVNLRQALAWHLQSNHYPPVPVVMVDPCLAAIDAFNDEDGEREVELPEGVTFRTGTTTVPAWQLAESLHLYAFVTNDEDDYDDDEDGES